MFFSRVILKKRMWSVLRRLGATYGFYQEVDCRDAHLLKLDKVDNAGVLDTEALHERARTLQCEFAEKALAITRDVSRFEAEVLLDQAVCPTPVMHTTPPQWEKHFTHLVAFSLLTIVSAGLCLFYASYFAVIKSDGSGRAIFNGRYLSQHFFRVPPPVCLPDLAELLRTIQDIFKSDKRRLFILTGDWRNWFHQIRLDPKIRQYFSLTMVTTQGRRFYHWTCLPMGWSWSPWIAQSVGYLLLITTLTELGFELPLGVRARPSPPPYLHLQLAGVTVFLCLWYDNVLFISDDGNMATSFYSHFETVCNRYRATRKYWNSFRGNDFLEHAKVPNFPIYLGLQFALSLRRQRDEYSVTLRWRPDPAKKSVWEASIEKGRSSIKQRKVTARETVRIIGRVLWEHHISLLPLHEISEIIEYTRTCSHVARRDGWDTPSHALEDCMIAVCDHAERRLRLMDTFRGAIPPIPTTKIFAASDSSNSLGGHVLWNSDREMLDCCPVRWDSKMRLAHIFVKELLAAVLLIERICRERQQILIVLGVDNTAAAWCLRRLFSSTEVGLELVKRAARALTSAHNALQVIQLGSLDNPADVPTRKKAGPLTLAERTSRFWAVVDGDRSRDIRPCTSHTSVRHSEEEPEADYDSDSDSEENEVDPDEDLWRQFDASEYDDIDQALVPASS